LKDLHSGGFAVQDSLQQLARDVQHNCHVADARHGAELTLCIYLMKMREYYRWEKGLPFSARLPRETVGDWLSQREQLWDALAAAEFSPLEFAGMRYDPFDTDAINGALAPLGMVYSAGLGYAGRAHFFLGELERREQYEGFTVYVSRRELARDLGAPPAMLRESAVYVRRESLRRMLWERLETWRWSRPDNAMGRAFGCYDFEERLEESLERMTETELRNVLLHEVGEFHAGVALGADWNRMVLAAANTPAELMMRAVRDHLADCISTLPALVEQGRPESIHFYIGNLSNMRKEIFPALQTAYASWLANGDLAALEAVARRGLEHWGSVGRQLIELYREREEAVAGPAERLLRTNYL
jgi:hypothetical protein